MRMDQAGETAAELVARLPEAELADTLYQLGEERLSRRIARAIVQARAEAPVATTRAAGRHHPPRRAEGRRRHRPGDPILPGPPHPVNDELGQVERALAQAAGLLGPGGRLIVAVVPFG